MALPSEYVIEDAIRSIDDVIVYQASHPIHDKVDIYLPDKNVAAEVAGPVRKRLYQNGRHMRNMSLLNLRFVSKALEISQNPNEPYIVTKHAEHDLAEMIGNGVIVKPKRMFSIVLQVLEGINNLSKNGWVIGRLHPRQVKLDHAGTGDISLNMIEGAGLRIETITKAAAQRKELPKAASPPAPAKNEQQTPVAVLRQQDTGAIEPDKSEQATSAIDSEDAATSDSSDLRSAAAPEQIGDAGDEALVTQRNTRLLGEIAYQLLFGRRYEASEAAAGRNLGSIAGRWRKILQTALNDNAQAGYSSYETMARVIGRALNRNKRIAIASIPFWLVLALLGGYFGYKQYDRHKIMTSEAGQAIERFLNIVNETSDEVAKIERPKPAEPMPDDDTILKPLENIEPISDD